MKLSCILLVDSSEVRLNKMIATNIFVWLVKVATVRHEMGDFLLWRVGG